MSIDTHPDYVPAKTSLAFAKSIFGAVLERTPQAKFLVAHDGGSRLIHGTAGALLPVARLDIKKKDFQAAERDIVLLLFDKVTHSAMALEYWVANVAAENVLLSSDSRFYRGKPQPLQSLHRMRIGANDLAAIAHAKAKRWH